MASAKKASDYCPYCRDQGLRNLTGAYQNGLGIQKHQLTMPADGILVFAAHGLSDMADTSYSVMIHNHTTEAKQGKSALADRKTTQLTIVGPAEGEVLDVVLIGAIKGQVS